MKGDDDGTYKRLLITGSKLLPTRLAAVGGFSRTYYINTSRSPIWQLQPKLKPLKSLFPIRVLLSGAAPSQPPQSKSTFPRVFR